MTTVDTTRPVGEIVMQQPGLARVFERLDIDYCCGGKMSLEDACDQKTLNVDHVVALLEEERQRASHQPDPINPATMTLTELADHIESTHHAYLRSELPRLHALTRKVSEVHGGRDARLRNVHLTLCALADELTSHMMKEERILFPIIRQMESGVTDAAAHCGTMAAPIRQMEHEHDQAGSALSDLRELTEGFAPPEWACNTYRAMLDALDTFEKDMHRHIHKENNVLFPRAMQMEQST
ncbi:MAG: iron-sulfur cluster repair di-iron protein [candidate division Zixibacteria bacterium]|nr:iron-sulfur cluster repair di-iron protein [candidate division Zixibacteria bacterium]